MKKYVTVYFILIIIFISCFLGINYLKKTSLINNFEKYRVIEQVNNTINDHLNTYNKMKQKKLKVGYKENIKKKINNVANNMENNNNFQQISIIIYDKKGKWLTATKYDKKMNHLEKSKRDKIQKKTITKIGSDIRVMTYDENKENILYRVKLINFIKSESKTVGYMKIMLPFNATAFSMSVLINIILSITTLFVIFLFYKERIKNKKSHVFHPLEPVYTSGNPIKSKRMFFGREDDFKKISNNIASKGHSIMFFKGGRRAGKSSILMQILNGRLNDILISILCDFQNISRHIQKDEDLADQIALAIFKHNKFKTYKEDYFSDTTSSFLKLEKLFRICIRTITPKKLLILGDEYEKLQELFENKILKESTLIWLKNLMDTHQIYFILTGAISFNSQFSHLLGPNSIEMDITLLSKQDTFRLIREPMEGKLKYSKRTVQKIYQLSGGHPFYTQCVCQALVNYLNMKATRNYIKKDDFTHVIEFMIRNPTGAMQDTWREFKIEQKSVLAAMAGIIKRPTQSVSTNKILYYIKQNNFPGQKGRFLSALSTLLKHQTNLIQRKNNQYSFKIDLMRYWIHHCFQIGEDIK